MSAVEFEEQGGSGTSGTAKGLLEGAGVASRWRIRHKLMLGLGLVLTTMVLLLAGTIRNIWSNYLDMSSLRVMTSQLHDAEDLRLAVGEITRLIEKKKLQGNDVFQSHPLGNKKEPDTLREFKLPPLPEDLADGLPKAKRKTPTTPEQAIEQANDSLNTCEASLLRHEPARNTKVELELLQILRSKFETLAKQWNRPDDHKRSPSLNVSMEPNLDDGKIDGEQEEQCAKLLGEIVHIAGDIRDHIEGDIRDRIGNSRGNYQITLWIVVPSSIVGLLLVIGLLSSFYAWVFHPIRDLEAGVNRVAKGDFEHRIDLHSGDEMEDLGEAFNDMMGRLQELYADLARQVNERSRQLVRSERLASVGFLAAGVAHEINNPLASIAFCSEALERRLDDLLRHLRANSRFDEEHEIFSKYLKMIQEEAFRCKNITERLLAFSRPGERRREKADLRELVQLVLDVTQHLPNHRGKEIQFEMSADRLAAGEPIYGWVNGEEIKSVILNLVVNALDSMDEGGKLTIRLGQRGDMAELQFTDTGCGMTQEVLENIFEPFYTRSRTGKGTGLGLTITHRIITQHGGEIEATSPGPNRGSTFIVRLPVKAESSTTLPGPGWTGDRKEEQAVPARAA
jgi:two-component system NtrC family sensor kinase